MKSIISIFWLFAFPFVINGAKIPDLYTEEVEKLGILARNKTEINKKLMLKENGFLGDGCFGVVYEGVILAENRSVAVKFVPDYRSRYCEREIEMFSYLEAYKNEDVEKYGIPVVYYYDRWESYLLIALTKLDADLKDIADKVRDFGDNPLDALILFRDFVFQSKYIHSHGVRHDDIKPRNIMVRGRRSFLIDFNMSSKMMKDNRGVCKKYACKRFASKATRRAIDDWESFLYTMSAILRTKWFGPRLDNKSRKNILVIKDEGLGKVVKAFANEVFTDDDSTVFPVYDRLYVLVNGEITKMHGNDSTFPPMFSWLTEAEKLTAKNEIESNVPLNIADIKQPSSNDFETFVYPHINVLKQQNQQQNQ